MQKISNKMDLICISIVIASKSLKFNVYTLFEECLMD